MYSSIPVSGAGLGLRRRLVNRQTGKYLGTLSTNKFDPDSTSNEYGKYGSKYSPDSINNEHGKYGSPYSPDGANNPYATKSAIDTKE